MGGNKGGIENHEQSLRLGQHGAAWSDNLGGVEELAPLAAKVARGKSERSVQRRRTQIIHLHVTGHRQRVQRTIQLAHGFVEQRGQDAAMNEARRPFVDARELDRAGGRDVAGVGGVNGEGELQSLRVLGTASEAEVGPFVDSASAGEA